MSKIEEFKNFVKDNPKLINYVKDGSMSWQKFYEMYDLYGKSNSVWDSYLTYDNVEVKKDESNNDSKHKVNVHDVVKMVKNMDVDKVQEGITSLQKAVDLFSSIFIKDGSSNSGSGYTPRPVYRRFDD